ncbi:MAG: hypothetical protein CW338_02990 [Clostridiales bacterium]|nr:hypothetical protein [Clostridiales bacterium]
MNRPRLNRHKDRQSAMSRRDQGVIVMIIALMIVVVLVASYGIIVMVERRARSSAGKLVSEVVEHIDGKMNEVADAARLASGTVYGILYDPDALEQFVYGFVERNNFIYGSTVAFEPDIFPGKGRCFAPYSWVTPDGQVHSRQLGTETDYYDEEWYAETKESESEYWCEPYFDEGGAKIMMCTFSVPLFDENGALVAVMTADVGLEDLEDYISTICPYPDSFIILRSRYGNIIVNGGKAQGADNDQTSVKGVTQNGWSVELTLPFTYLMRGDTGVFFLIGVIFLITIIFVYSVNRLLYKMQQRSSAEYMNVIDAISSSFSSIYLVDLVTGGTVVFRDPAPYEDLICTLNGEKDEFSKKLELLIGHDCYEQDRPLMHREVRLEQIRENLVSQDRYAVRFRKAHDNEARWHEMLVFAMERGDGGMPLRAVIAFTDVNDSVQKEQETQDALKQALGMAESANNAKTTFLFNMSHDIRTPMNAIIGFTNMAKKHIDDPGKVMDCLNKTQQSSNLLLMLINSVLDVSRIESGRAELQESPADVQYSFTAIQDTMTELAAARDIGLSFEIGDIRDRYVYCDLNRCNRVFVNIISNAVKFTHEGGTVKVRCDQVDCPREGWGSYRYTFADNGIGMSEEFQKNIFDQFAREQSTTVSGIEGSGLGLTVCKAFVELMGGTITFTSKQNKGTTFVVTLPFRLQKGQRYVDPFTREEVNASDVKVLSQQIVFRGKRTLLVDDNELNLEIAGEILEEEGLTVETARDGATAVEIMREKGPAYFDFILMDIQMPVMNGYEATRAIRALYPDAKIPIIAVSANAFDEDRKASRDAGMDDHVAKPIKVQELFSVLARYM